MTCSRKFDRLLQVTCLGLVGILAGAGCGGSSKSTPDAKPAPDALRPDAPVIIPDGPVVPVGGLTVGQPTVNFGSVDQGGSATKTVTVTNTGVPAVVSPQVAGVGYILDSTTCPAVALPNGGSCTITIALKPAADASGGASGTLTIGTGTGAITVSLSGNVTALGTFSASLSILPATALVNQAVPFTVTVTPAGPLPNLSCLSSGTDVSADPVATNTTCAATALAPVVQPCAYSFIFKGAKAGVATDKISCSSSGKVVDLPVSVNVLSPASLTISPTPVSFGGEVGKTSDPATTFRVRNNGTASSGALTAAFTGTGAAQFAMTDNQCSGVLAGGATCTIAVVFKPTSAATFTTTLTVTDATAGSTPATATLTGIAVTGGAVAITGPADLGSVMVGQGGTPATFTLANSGGTASDLVKIGVTDAQFSIGNNLCDDLPLAPGKSCTFTVTFTPGSEGVKTTVLTAKSGAENAAQKQIQGTGVAAPRPPVLSMSPPQLDFGTIGVGTVAGPQSFTVTNTGGTASGLLNVIKLDSTSSVGGASQFSYTTTCGPSLAPGATCMVAVKFEPTISRSASGSFTVSDATVSSLARTVIGIALDRPTISLVCGDPETPTYSDRTGDRETFVDTVLGKTESLVCTVSNDPNSPQETGNIALVVTGDFAAPTATNTCTASLRPGLSCTFALTFTPTVMGQRNGTLTLTTDNQGARNKDLSGVGLGVVEIVEFTACPTLGPPSGSVCFPTHPTTSAPLTANLVDPEPYDFGQVTEATTSPAATALTLAVYVRAAVGNLAVTKVFGTPESFVFGEVPSGLGEDCSLVPSVTAVDASLTVPACFKIVQFFPQARTPLSGTVTVNGAAGQTDSATMTGTGTGPLTISPSPATFSNVGVGSASATIPLVVTNNGSNQIDGMRYTLTGTNANQFKVVEDTLTGSYIVGEGGTKTIGVKYIPTATGGATATITVTGTLHNGAGSESQTVNLLGNGATGAVMTVAISNNGVFADTAAGAYSAPLTVTVSNATGSLPTGNVYFSVMGGDFQVSLAGLPAGTTQGTCQLTANPSVSGGLPVVGGGNCTYLVWFAPSMADALVARTGTLVVTASPGGSATLALSGNALPQITISPTGNAGAPVDIGTAVVSTLPNPSVTFTVTNRAATDIPPNGLLISKILSTDIPNNAGLFNIDTSASNGCNSTNGVPKSGGICTFKLSAIATGSTPLGVSYSRMLVQVADHPAQAAQADVKATVVTGANLMFTPATDVAPGVARDIGVVALGVRSAPVKYTLVNVGGMNSGAITAAVYLHGGVAVQTTARYVVDATACTSLGEAGLAPGRTCDILVTFTSTATDTNAILNGSPNQSVDLVVPATNGLSVELRRWIQAEVTDTQQGPFLVNSVAGADGVKRAPAFMTGPVGATNVYTATIELHVGDATITPATGYATITSTSSPDDSDLVTVAPGDVSGCSTTLPVTNGNMCTLKLTFTAGATPTPGWRVFTVTTNDSTETTMNVFARVAQPAQLVASRSSVDFGQTLIGSQSQAQTVVVTNMGEAATVGNVVVTPSSASLINTSGCAGLPLAYLGTCTLTIRVTALALGHPTTPTITLTPSAVATTIALDWDGVTASLLTTTSPAHDFGPQAVLSTTDNKFTFTFVNGDDALMTGPLVISVLNGTAVNPDFVITGGTCVTTNSGLGLDSGDTCTVVVIFVPTTLATPAKSGTLTVSASPGGTATVALNGKAVPALSVTAPPAVVTAADGSQSLAVVPTVSITSPTGIENIIITFTNEAAAPRTGLLSVALGGTNAADFHVTEDHCTGVQLPPLPPAVQSRDCTVTLTFAPTAAGINKTATLTVSGSPGDSAVLTLTGTGTSP